MNQWMIAKVVTCALSFGGVLYAYLEQQNDMTKLKAGLPLIAKEVRYLEEEVTRLSYEIERFENPGHLLELAKRPEFSHLKHPMVDEILVLKKGEVPHFRDELESATKRVDYMNDRGSTRVFLGSAP